MGRGGAKLAACATWRFLKRLRGTPIDATLLVFVKYGVSHSVQNEHSSGEDRNASNNVIPADFVGVVLSRPCWHAG
jgi:hypothetical protein